MRAGPADRRGCRSRRRRRRRGGRTLCGPWRGPVADRGLASRRGKRLVLRLARLERTAAHDSMLGCGHLDRRGRRGHDHLGGAARARPAPTAPGSSPPARARRPARARTSGSATATAAGSSALAAAFFVVFAAAFAGFRLLLRLLGTDQPIAFGPPPHSICLCLFDARRMALDANSERDREVECLLVGHPELFGQLVEADLCGQGCSQPFGWGLGEISSRARQPMGLSSAVAHSRMSGPISAHRSSNERR